MTGLVIIDYVQLMSVPVKEKGQQAHEAMMNWVSRIVKTASVHEAVVVFLSQLNKADQKEATAGGTALAGADLARCADAVVMVQKAKQGESRWEACAPHEHAEVVGGGEGDGGTRRESARGSGSGRAVASGALNDPGVFAAAPLRRIDDQ